MADSLVRLPNKDLAFRATLEAPDVLAPIRFHPDSHVPAIRPGMFLDRPLRGQRAQHSIFRPGKDKDAGEG